MKRVGVLVNSLTRVDVNTGGYTYMANIVNALVAAGGFEIVFFGPANWKSNFLEAIPGASYVTMPSFSWLPLRADLVLRAVFGIARRRRLRECDALFTWSHFIADVLPAVAANPNRTVATIHHFIGRPRANVADWIAWLGQESSLVFLRRAGARFVFVSPFVMREAASLVRGRPAFLTANAVDPPAGFEPLPGAQRTGGIYLGRLHPSKRVDDAIRAWNALPPALRAQPLRIVGRGEASYESELRALTLRLGLTQSVVFAGAVDDATKWRLLGESAIFVFPSAEEGWGIAVAEAMAARLPCVTYDLPVYRELFPAGRIEVPLGDIDALSRACAHVLSDAALRERLGREGAAIARTFSWEASAETLARALTF
jgi:glycosyltransferase involved in cell wall biosynthesis